MTKAALVIGTASLAAAMFVTAASAKDWRQRERDAHYGNYSPSEVRERQKHRRTFDETKYYERLSEKIPFGTAAWWRQRQLETMPRSTCG